MFILDWNHPDADLACRAFRGAQTAGPPRWVQCFLEWYDEKKPEPESSAPRAQAFQVMSTRDVDAPYNAVAGRERKS